MGDTGVRSIHAALQGTQLTMYHIYFCEDSYSNTRNDRGYCGIRRSNDNGEMPSRLGLEETLSRCDRIPEVGPETSLLRERLTMI